MGGNRAVPPEGRGLRLLTGSPLIVVALPTLIMAFGVYLPVARLARESTPFSGMVFLLLAASAIALYFIDNARERPPVFVSSMRELAGTLLLSGLLVWAVVRGPLADFIRSSELWIALSSVGLLFFVRATLQRALLVRRFFVRAVLRAVGPDHAQSEAPPTVAGATREFSVEAGEASAGVTRVRRFLVFFLLWAVATLIVDGWVLKQQDELLQVGLLVAASAVLFGFTVLGRMDEEQRLLTEGILPSREGSTLRSLIGGLLFGCALLLALVVASRPALLSQSTLSEILAWIAWLLSHLPSVKPRPFVAPPRLHAPAPPRAELFNELKQLPSVHGSDIVGRLLTYLGWTLAALAVAGLLWVLLSPLFRADYRRRGPKQWLGMVVGYLARLAGDVAGWLRELVAALTGLRGTRPATQRERTRTGVRAPGRKGGFLGSLIGTGGRRFNRGFFRVVRWGEAHGVSFSRSDGPREYLDRVEKRIGESGDLLRLIGELYERHLYSPDPLSAKQLNAYFKAIGEVVRHERG